MSTILAEGALMAAKRRFRPCREKNPVSAGRMSKKAPKQPTRDASPYKKQQVVGNRKKWMDRVVRRRRNPL